MFTVNSFYKYMYVSPEKFGFFDLRELFARRILELIEFWILFAQNDHLNLSLRDVSSTQVQICKQRARTDWTISLTSANSSNQLITVPTIAAREYISNYYYCSAQMDLWTFSFSDLWVSIGLFKLLFGRVIGRYETCEFLNIIVNHIRRK